MFTLQNLVLRSSRHVSSLVVFATMLASVTMTAAPGAESQGANRSAERNDQSPGIRNVVLVHGAWADGSSWAKVIPLLEAHGLNVVAVQNPLTSLADDVATTTRAIARLDGPVLLVGHSYGGAVITQAGDDPRVAGLVYIAAFAPEVGESVLDLLTAYPTPIADDLVLDSFGFITLTERGVREDFAQDLPAKEQSVIAAAQGPTALAAGGTKISQTAWRVKPSYYLVAKRDRTISPELEQLFADRMGATTLTLRSSHVPMLSRPAAVAAFIVRAARELE